MMALDEVIHVGTLLDERDRRIAAGLPQCKQFMPTDAAGMECSRPYEHDGIHIATSIITPMESIARWGEPREILVIVGMWPR